jgi:hypothetical protein
MAEQQAAKKDIAVDLECDDEFEEFGNEGACVLWVCAFLQPARHRLLARARK